MKTTTQGTARGRLQAAMRGRTTATAALALAVAATVVACGGGGGGGTPVVTPPVVTPPVITPAPVVNGPAWLGFGGNAQHTAQAGVATQTLSRIAWQAPVDNAPQYTAQGYLLTHYGSPVISSKNTVLVPVKGSATGAFRVEARAGHDGSVMWTMETDYIKPASNWVPSYNISLTAGNRVYAPGAGGKLYYRDNVDTAGAAIQTVVFYGDATYAANKAALDAGVFINTPVTLDSAGNVYFGFTAAAGNAAGLSSGFARIGADGKAGWVGARAVSGEAAVGKPAMNSAPALSTDQKTLYVVVNGDPGTPSLRNGYLLALDAGTLALKGKVQLVDPHEKLPARISDDSTASPMVGPDGDVYIGVLEATYGSHNARGWLLHFDASLATSKTPGSFGWDITPSIVPASMVPSYTGGSSYLLMTKYNNYQRAGTGDGMNRIAVIDPFAAQADPVRPAVQVMKDVLTMLAPTPDPNAPGGFIEWCINTAAVDPATKSVLVNSEDGYLYRWDLATNTLSQKIRLTSGLGESYTPTAIGPDGAVYAINNAILFSLGK